MQNCKLTRLAVALVAIAALVVPSLVLAQTDAGTPDVKHAVHNEPDYSPFVDQHFPTRVLWGDNHLHTRLSIDAGFMGTTLGPEEAYRFARGEEVRTSSGQRAKLIKPLDWLVIADHGVYYGLIDLISTGDPALLANETGKRWYQMFNGTKEEGMAAFYEALNSVNDRNEVFKSPAAKKTVWERSVGIAEKYNQPGVFTAIHGYEWSSVPDGNNLHRVVMFRDGADRVKQVVPFSAFDSDDPEEFWRFLAGYEEKTGGQVLAIPHNGNLSNGRMFGLDRSNGKPIDAAYAKNRARWEPLYEATQVKGDGEAHPFLSPDDEFADFGTWDRMNLGGTTAEPKTRDMLEFEYARSALKLGLQQEEKLGTNPFKFGLIGATDNHTGLATAREDNFFGKNRAGEPSEERSQHWFVEGPTDALSIHASEILASGLAGVWARENTRESIWDAFKRKEVYATTGSRILVRVFGGWEFSADDIERQDFAEHGYMNGVPMGGDLKKAPKGKALTLMIRALRDPDNANLDRIQVVKGWVDKDGKSHERIYDVAVSDGRQIDKNGRCKTPVGNTVSGATYTNTIGDPLLKAFWKDPDFNPDQPAFYYIRVIEIPKPSWLAYDAAYYGFHLSNDRPATVQDRAYTSPIWYTP